MRKLSVHFRREGLWALLIRKSMYAVDEKTPLPPPTTNIMCIA